VAELWNDLVDCLTLHQETDDVFEGRNLPLSYHRLFGGQLLAQFVRAAQLAAPDKRVKSLHALFPREGRRQEPVRYQATVHYSGRSFTTLSIVAAQPSRGPIATASVSMHSPEGGPERQTVADVPAIPGPDLRVEMDLLPWETRTTDDLDSTGAAAPEYALWMQTPALAPELAPAVAAYATDLTLIGTALRPAGGLSQRGNGTQFISAVTSHTVWFHRPFTTADWLLLRQHSPLVAGSRAFGRGDILSATGSLLASYTQESLLRLPPDESRSP
jgi:acyl-CoA thioesterase-2